MLISQPWQLKCSDKKLGSLFQSPAQQTSFPEEVQDLQSLPRFSAHFKTEPQPHKHWCLCAGLKWTAQLFSLNRPCWIFQLFFSGMTSGFRNAVCLDSVRPLLLLGKLWLDASIHLNNWNKSAWKWETHVALQICVQDKEELFISPQTIQAFGAMCLISQTRGSPEPPKEREMGFLPPIKTLDFQRLAKNIHFFPLLSSVAPVQKATEMSA